MLKLGLKRNWFWIGVFFIQSEIGTSLADSEGSSADPPKPEFSASSQGVVIPEAGVRITPPEGWSASRDVAQLTLVMKEPGDPKPSYDKPKYQRNVTLMTLHQSSPMDFARMEEFKQELTKQFSQGGSTSNFQIVDSKIFDYRQNISAILVYSSIHIGEYPMMQMHVLVSGKDKQYVMTYTDLAERFNQTNDPAFSAVWASMMSIEVEGTPPTRFEQRLGFYLGGGGIFMIAMAMGLWSFARSRTSYRHYADLAVSGRDLDEDLSSASSTIHSRHDSRRAQRMKKKSVKSPVRSPMKASAQSKVSKGRSQDVTGGSLEISGGQDAVKKGFFHGFLKGRRPKHSSDQELFPSSPDQLLSST